MKRFFHLLCVVAALHTHFAQAADQYVLPAAYDANLGISIWGVANYDAIEPVFLAFQAQFSDIAIHYTEHSSLELYHRIIQLPDNAPQKPDIVMSSAMDLQFKLVNDGYAQPYQSSVTEVIPSSSKWRDEVFAFTFEPIVMVVNQDILGLHVLPESREQLLSLIRERSPLVHSKIGVSDIETVGLGYLTWFHDSLQSRTYGRLLEAFGSHHAQLYPNSSDMLQALLKGEIFIAYNVLGSYAMEWSRRYPWIQTIMPTDYTSVVMRTAFIYKEAERTSQTQQFLDFLLSSNGQNVLAKRSSLVPISDSAQGPNSLIELRRRTHGIFRPMPLGLPLLVQTDEAKRSLLLQEWRNAMSPNP